MSTLSDYDICIIGGGINGAGIARDLAGRGYRVCLLEKSDLASATSSASTKLIHGGLRYLEHYEFGLVRAALKEREVLLNNAPHIIWPLTFVLPHSNRLRPAWLIRLGLWLYDHLGGRERLPKSGGLNLRKHAFGEPLQDIYKQGFHYTDCWVEDTRLVVLNAMAARDSGAHIYTRTACTGLTAENGQWRVESNQGHTINANMVINAAGSWVRELLDDTGLQRAARDFPSIRRVKGSHIVVPRLYQGEQAYTLQQNDGRIVFAVPYERDYTLIGTTDTDYDGDPGAAELDDNETAYLLNAANTYFTRQLEAGDIIHSYSGVRPLIDDGGGEASNASRDYKLHSADIAESPIINVYGGKLTTYRVLAQACADMAEQRLVIDAHGHWTRDTPLPGGDMESADFAHFYTKLHADYPFLDAATCYRLARSYGTLARTHILGDACREGDLGVHFGCGIYEAEIAYLINYEFAQTLEDILWRRSKLGLHIDIATHDRLRRYLDNNKTETGQ